MKKKIILVLSHISSIKVMVIKAFFPQNEISVDRIRISMQVCLLGMSIQKMSDKWSLYLVLSLSHTRIFFIHLQNTDTGIGPSISDSSCIFHQKTIRTICSSRKQCVPVNTWNFLCCLIQTLAGITCEIGECHKYHKIYI